MRHKCRAIAEILIVFVSLLTLLFSGCSNFLTTSSATTTKTAPTTSTSSTYTTTKTTTALTPITITADVLFSDDFSNSNSGWLTGPKEYGDYYYEPGEYSLLELQEKRLMYASFNKQCADGAIQVDARCLNLGENGDFGIIFRLQDEEVNANYYLFAVNNNSFRLLLRYGGEWRTIQKWTQSEYIYASPDTNRLMAVFLGPQINVYANGQLLGSYIDNTLASGIFGLEVAEANTHTHFDNLVIHGVTSSEVNPGPPDLAREYYDKAVQYRKDGNHSQAIIYYQKAIKEYYWYYEAWYEEAQTYYEAGEYDNALNCYYTVTKINPQDSGAWVDEGKCLEALGRNDEAMSCYNRALQLDPDNAQARANKDSLLARGVADNNDNPPEKKYDNAHPLKLTGPVMVIHLKEGEPFSTTFTVEGGQPPYYWWLITTNGVAFNVIAAAASEDGSAATVTGYGEYIESPSTTAREATIEIGVEDSSALTRMGKGSFWIHVENGDDSEIAAQVAREWYAANYGDVNSMMQQALAGVGFGGISEAYSTPLARNDGYYQVTVTITALAGAEGVAVSADMDVILIIDTRSREVIDVIWGEVRTGF